MAVSKQLGKRLPVGRTFISSSPRMSNKRHWYLLKEHFKIYKVGEKGWFQKGKRKYWCQIVMLQETTTGVYIGNPKKRYWQFKWLVKILEN